MMKVTSFFLASVAFAGSASFANAQRSELYVMCMNGSPSPNQSRECKQEGQEVLNIIDTCVDAAYANIANAGTSPTPMEPRTPLVTGISGRRELEEPVEGQEDHRSLWNLSDCYDLNENSPTYHFLNCCLLSGEWNQMCASNGYRRRNLRSSTEIATAELGTITKVVDETCTKMFHSKADALNKMGNHDCWQDVANGKCKSFFVTL